MILKRNCSRDFFNKYNNIMAGTEKLKIVTSEKAGKNQLFIGGTKAYPNLSYIDENNNVITVLSSSKTLNRPLQCNEVYLRLIERCWNKADGDRYIASNGENSTLYYRATILEDTKQRSNISSIKEDSIEAGIPKEDGFIKISNNINSINDINYINSEFIKRFGSDTVEPEELKGFSQHIPPRVELIHQNSTTYTNRVDLREFIDSRKRATASITIQYSKIKTDNNEVYVCGRDVLMEISGDNYIQNINNDIQAEFFNGILQVFPLNNSVVEYIISRCNLIYEDLQN